MLTGSCGGILSGSALAAILGRRAERGESRGLLRHRRVFVFYSAMPASGVPLAVWLVSRGAADSADLAAGCRSRWSAWHRPWWPAWGQAVAAPLVVTALCQQGAWPEVSWPQRPRRTVDLEIPAGRQAAEPRRIATATVLVVAAVLPVVLVSAVLAGAVPQMPIYTMHPVPEAAAKGDAWDRWWVFLPTGEMVNPDFSSEVASWCAGDCPWPGPGGHYLVGRTMFMAGVSQRDDRLDTPSSQELRIAHFLGGVPAGKGPVLGESHTEGPVVVAADPGGPGYVLGAVLTDYLADENRTSPLATVMLYFCRDEFCVDHTSRELGKVNVGDGLESTSALDIALTPSGAPVVSHFDRSADALTLFMCGDAACSAPRAKELAKPFSERMGHRVDVEVRSDGRPLILYTRVRDIASMLVNCRDVLCDTYQEIVVGAAYPDGGSSLSSLAVDGSDRPQIVLADAGQDRLTYLACSDPTAGPRRPATCSTFR